MANHNTRTMETVRMLVVRMLVVSRETAVLQCFWLTADSSSWANGWGAMERMQSGRIADSLFLDIPRGNADGLRVLRWLRRLRPDLPVIVIGNANDGCKSREAMRMGARDYLSLALLR